MCFCLRKPDEDVDTTFLFANSVTQGFSILGIALNRRNEVVNNSRISAPDCSLRTRVQQMHVNCPRQEVDERPKQCRGVDIQGRILQFLLVQLQF
ncbi:hypothetical protein TNCV_1490861 [Trichonephila clavipes]|nr:hypothetical protein TNCV_1490861 [Trichonephila clavipes]